MFLTLLLVTFLISLATSLLVVRLFRDALAAILAKLVASELTSAWHRYFDFAICVVGVSGGVRIWQLEQYITPRSEAAEVVMLTTDRWVLEVYRTVIGTLQSSAWLLLAFFVTGLIAYVIVVGLASRQRSTT